MKIIYTDRFVYEIWAIADFIALDSWARAEAFVENAERLCESLVDMPYKCRKSFKFDDENVRDLIYKGYVIPYLVESECISILGIYKENAWEFE